ncbi:hypothetical protein B0J12DRAFT_62297 [Macrophomina phaseolina]|uniref:Uncharacterized protein n=1 Tax=Macrophomina phaseolina TaxID=35725 RepID=A0ABQ8GCK8_9PEZI|nr:hypothetical protein B0J12DRAFT_62297 [Macrophomina phaseolina]
MLYYLSSTNTRKNIPKTPWKHHSLHQSLPKAPWPQRSSQEYHPQATRHQSHQPHNHEAPPKENANPVRPEGKENLTKRVISYDLSDGAVKSEKGSPSRHHQQPTAGQAIGHEQREDKIRAEGQPDSLAFPPSSCPRRTHARTTSPPSHPTQPLLPPARLWRRRRWCSHLSANSPTHSTQKTRAVRLSQHSLPRFQTNQPQPPPPSVRREEAR